LAAILGPAFVPADGYPGARRRQGRQFLPVEFASNDQSDIAVRAAMFLAEQHSPSTDEIVDALTRTGLTGTMVAAVADGLRRGHNVDGLLLTTFRGLPPAPPLPRCAGNLIVVVGPATEGRRLAAALAGALGTDPASVPLVSLEAHPYSIVASTRLVRSAEEAAQLAPGWRRSQPAIVVVEAPVTGRNRAWAARLITSLRATTVWGVVDATLKSEDISRWAKALGGLQALALENIDITVSPAAILAAGIPVARLGGHPASAARWTATIVDRLSPLG
jgi:hypothetical protein